MVSLNSNPQTTAPARNRQSAKSRRLERVARVNEQISEACRSMNVVYTGLGLADLEKAIQEATVINGVELQYACEMLRPNTIGKLDFDEIYQKSVRRGYHGVLKCLLTIPLKEWTVSYDAHLFLAMAYKSAHYDGDFWHARWLESDFRENKEALYASGNICLFKHLEELPKLSQKSSPVLSVRLFWKYFETIIWKDAVGTVEYFADELDLTAISERRNLLFKCYSTKIINFLRSRNVLSKTDFDFGVGGTREGGAGDEALETKCPENTENDGIDGQQAEEHQFAEHAADVDANTQPAQSKEQNPRMVEQNFLMVEQDPLMVGQDNFAVKRENWNSLKRDNNRRIIERLIKCDTSLKEEYKNLKPQELDEKIGIQVSRGTDKLCLLEAIKANTNLPKDPDELINYAFEKTLSNLAICMQAFFLKNFGNQDLIHSYMAVLYKTSECDNDLWMRFWFYSRFDLYNSKTYFAMNANLLKDLHQLPQNPDAILPATTAEKFLEYAMTANAIRDALDVLQYFEQNHALDLNEVAKHLNTFIIYGAKKIVEHLVHMGHVELGMAQVILAIKYDRVEMVKLATKFGFKPNSEVVTLAQVFESEECIKFFRIGRF